MSNPIGHQESETLSALARRWGAVLSLVICAAAAPVSAQVPAANGVVEYIASESGGRIRLLAHRLDSTSVESVRRALLEAAAAIRRGDLRRALVLRTDAPDLPTLADKSRLIQCTFRPLPRGGELILLSEDGDTVAAIQRLLAYEPPRPGPD